jgi:NAD-dependent deacetylase
VLEAVPHSGYHALVELESLVPSLTVVTQNVDGLHALAGSRDVVEVHGNLHRAKCLDAHHPFPGDPPLPEGDEADPPPCPVCGSPLRPDVVWFGEMLPQGAVERAWRLAERCDVLLLVGTSGTVWPAAELPSVAKSAGARVIEINPAPSELTPTADVFLQGRAGIVLPRLAREVAERKRMQG